MSTLNEPNWSMCSIALNYPARSHFQRTLNRERQGRVKMNVAAHQEKDKNEKTGKRKAGVERRQANFKEATCCPSAVVQGASRRKNGLRGGVPGVTGTLGKTNSHFDPTQTSRGPHFTIQKDRNQYVF